MAARTSGAEGIDGRQGGRPTGADGVDDHQGGRRSVADDIDDHQGGRKTGRLGCLAVVDNIGGWSYSTDLAGSDMPESKNRTSQMTGLKDMATVELIEREDGKGGTDL